MKKWLQLRLREKKSKIGPPRRMPFSGCVACWRTNSMLAALLTIGRSWRRTREWPVIRPNVRKTGAMTKNRRTRLR